MRVIAGRRNMNKTKSQKNIRHLSSLLLKSGKAVRIVNLITLYRIVAFPILILVILLDQQDILKWLLLASFFTDAIDGYLARTFKATSILGTKLDSIGDDLTVLAAVIGLFKFKFDFINEQLAPILILLGLFLIQLTFSIIRYKKISSFHTYLAKIAAISQALFLLSVFFFDTIYYPLFYASFGITALELIEETIIVLVLPKWRANVKGLYWVLKEKGR
jgi:phosphatidylglycerophosphate synthase